MEANIYSEDRQIVDDALCVFKDLWKSAEKVRPKDIAAARLARIKSGFFPPPKGKTLFDACRANPAAFEAVYVVPYDDGLSKQASLLLRLRTR